MTGLLHQTLHISQDIAFCEVVLLQVHVTFGRDPPWYNGTRAAFAGD